MAHCPDEKHLHASAPVVPGTGSTSPTHELQMFSVLSSAEMQVVVPSLQSPRPRFARSPVQHAAVVPSGPHEHPGRFLSLGHISVPPIMGGAVPPSTPQYLGGGSFTKKAS